ncbi:MAG: RagB/SusD family nutrient uptake outer membrane protein [Cyclobacteriaceae bacterium]
MKIKTIIIAAGSAFLMLVSFSCDEGFLDKNPLDQISNKTFWNTKADVDMALAGCYARLRGGFLGYERPYLDCLSDNAVVPFDSYFGFPSVTLGNLNPNTSGGRGGFFQKFYNVPYDGISTFNYFLENIDRVSSIDANQRNIYKGEVQFLRALVYFDLVQSFGGVILYTELPENVEESRIAKSSKEDVLNFIHQDLDFAIANLPNEPYSGHAVKGSAMALKTRVLLYEQKWTEAATISMDIISSEIFGLSDNYSLMFLTAGQENNPEIMFSVRYLSPNSPQHSIEGMDVEFGWYGGISAYQDLVDDYELIDGQSVSESPIFEPNNPYQNRDPRLDMTIKLPGEIWTDPTGNPYEGEPALTDFKMEKYIDFEHAPFNYGKANLTDQDYIHIRYADVLLMYAEATNEVSGPDATVYGALDEIRARPGVNMPPVDQSKYNTKDLLRDYIRRERRVELALEGQRYFDLKRWNIAHIKMPTINNPAGIPLKFEQHHYLLPFPQYELDVNAQLEQNPGY